jgi:hypothetical protein
VPSVVVTVKPQAGGVETEAGSTRQVNAGSIDAVPAADIPPAPVSAEKVPVAF